MCLIAVAWQVSPSYPLLVAANRDERHARPTAPARWWLDRPLVFGGRDLTAGGTWLAVDRRGRLAAVTNFRDGTPLAGLRSRGALITGFLEQRGSAADFEAAITPELREYGPFNLLLFDGVELRYVSNRAPARRLTPGIHALSNTALGNDWPKTRSAAAGMERALGAADPAEALLTLLAQRAPGDPEETYRSAHFIEGPVYGTRSSTVVLLDARGRLTFVERSFDAAARVTGEVRETFAPALGGSRAH